MKIFGYSERGAMNALFYGIAHQEKAVAENAMNEFLKLAGISDNYEDFNLFMEFSLSDFGEPDLVIIAKNAKTQEKTAFFVEAKASVGGKFDLEKEWQKHNDFLDSNGEKRKDGHSSNLFFQIRLKHCFFEKNHNEPKLICNKTNGARKIGENKIVNKFAKIITSCAVAKYIAIIPEKQNFRTGNDFCDNNISYLSWQEISENENLCKFIKETFDFNKEDVSQILNN